MNPQISLTNQDEVFALLETHKNKRGILHWNWQNNLDRFSLSLVVILVRLWIW